jgi:hypothetical protein
MRPICTLTIVNLRTSEEKPWSPAHPDSLATVPDAVCCAKHLMISNPKDYLVRVDQDEGPSLYVSWWKHEIIVRSFPPYFEFDEKLDWRIEGF